MLEMTEGGANPYCRFAPPPSSTKRRLYAIYFAQMTSVRTLFPPPKSRS